MAVEAQHTHHETKHPGLDADVVAGLRNASKLGLSLMGTWGVALVVRILLPRQLGPALFGAFQFADAFSSALFVLATLGIETYVRKEVAIRREHAAEFYGGVFALRLVLCTILVIAAVVGLMMAGKPPLVLRLVLVLATMQFFVMQNATYAALLHAVGKVDGLSVLNVASKLIWGGGALIGLLSGGGVVSVAIAMLVSEALKMGGLEVLVRRHFSLRARIDVRATLTVIVGSMPFFATGLSQALAGKINVSLMSFLASDVEIGWFGAASSIASIALLLSPLLGWILLPLTARAESRSSEELTTLTRRAMMLVLTVAVPITLMLALSADVIVNTLFGSAFAPAALSLRVLAPTFVLTYVGIVSSGALIGQGRSWTVTVILLSSLVLSPLLNWLLIPRTLAALGAGGAGVGAGIALNVTEAFNAVALTVALGNRAFDRRARLTVAKMAVACLIVVAVDRLALSGYGVLRLVADALLYAGLVTLWNAGDHMALVRVLTQTIRRRKTHHATAV
jgi:O-antigen/teichoic acid export membrane protein